MKVFKELVSYRLNAGILEMSHLVASGNLVTWWAV